MKVHCPYKSETAHLERPELNHFVRIGYFFRKSDSKYLKRYLCRVCEKSFSQATFQSCFRQKKRRINALLKWLLCSGVSMRRCALILNVHRITIARRLKFFAGLAQLNQENYLEKLKDNKVKIFHLDDLLTFIKTKLAPVSISMIVVYEERKILGFAASIIPAFGKKAAESRLLYGKRPNQRAQNLDQILNKLKDVIDPYAEIKTDKDPLYPFPIKKHFPHATHLRFKGRRAREAGLGELKKGGYDPLFSSNHVLASMRANISRLIRKTWNTSKKMECLIDHLTIYMDFHNNVLTK